MFVKRSKWLLACLIFLLTFISGYTFSSYPASALEDFSLNSKLSLSATPMPCSLTDEIKSETPCERSFLKWDVESILDLDFRIAKTDFFIDSALSIAHPEHLILGLETDLGEITLKPEIWFAVPFEGITDANNMYNTVAIPPGNPLFATARLTTTFNIGDVRFRNLFMFSDVNFPHPGSDFAGLEYGPQSQSFSVGNIFYFSGRTEGGISYSSRTSFCASGFTSVKNYSASGGVDPDCDGGVNERFSLSGIRIGELYLTETLDIDVTDDVTATSRTGLSFSILDWTRISTALTADIIPFDVNMSGISVGLSVKPFRFNISFSDLHKVEFNAATASYRQRFGLGMINGAFSANATVQNERGLTGVSMAMFVSQGTVSTSHSLSFSKRNGEFKFSYLNNRINLRLSPFTFTASPAFSINGLTRLAVTTGVMF